MKLCLKRKQSCLASKSDIPKRLNYALEVVHFDICCPCEVSSLGGNKYFINFVDEHIRMLQVYTIKFKSDSIEVFTKLKSLIEKENEKTIKVLRTDNGGEYTSKEFDSFLIIGGIKHEVISPYTP